MSFQPDPLLPTAYYRTEGGFQGPRAREGAAPCAEESDAEAASPTQAFEQWRRPVWRTLRHLGVLSTALEDATQDVFIIVHHRWHSFRGQSTRRTWVFGIAIRVASEYRRRQNRRLAAEVQLPVQQALEASQEAQLHTDPFRAAAVQEEAGQLQALLGHLSEEQQALFVLVYIEEQSVGDAALATCISVKRAYRQLRKARSRFQLALQRSQARDQSRLR